MCAMVPAPVPPAPPFPRPPAYNVLPYNPSLRAPPTMCVMVPYAAALIAWSGRVSCIDRPKSDTWGGREV